VVITCRIQASPDDEMGKNDRIAWRDEASDVSPSSRHQVFTVERMRAARAARAAT